MKLRKYYNQATCFLCISKMDHMPNQFRNTKLDKESHNKQSMSEGNTKHVVI